MAGIDLFIFLHPYAGREHGTKYECLLERHGIGSVRCRDTPSSIDTDQSGNRYSGKFHHGRDDIDSCRYS